MARRLNPERLRAARAAKGYTASRLAQEIGVSEVTVRTWESGRYNPSAENLETLARALEVALEDISTEDLCPTCGQAPAPTKRRLASQYMSLVPQGWPLWLRETLTSKDPGNYNDHVRYHPVVAWAWSLDTPEDASAAGVLVPVIARLDRMESVIFTPEPPDPTAWDYAVELVTEAPSSFTRGN